MKLILLNGPPRSGKDECAKILFRRRPGIIERFSNPLKRMISAFLGISMERLEETKDQKLYFNNRFSYRDLQILFSEKFIKPIFGQRVFGHLLGQRLHELDLRHANYVVVPDVGFEAELLGLEDTGAWDIKIIRIERPGKTFDNDSRGYLRNPDFTIHNDSTLESLEGHLMWFVKEIER